MKPISQLNLGFRDAESYKIKDNKELLNKIFLRDHTLDDLGDLNKYFLIGEKGTGKTAYAVFYSNNNYKNTHSTIKYIRETEYKKFLELKKTKHLNLSDYTNIWKVILMLLLSELITKKELKHPILQRFSKFKALKDSVDEFYLNAFSPEILSAINFAEESSLSASILNKNFKLVGEEKSKIEFSEARFQVNLLYIQKHFEDALSSLSLNENYTLFIDGVDIRPYDIEFEDYLDCVKGLANAIWSLNTDFFGNIKGSKGRLKTVLLIRPDIFDSIGFQNQNSKVRDNSVILDWNTLYPEHRSSNLFLLADKLLAHQQDHYIENGMTWDYYFPFNSRNVIYKSSSLTSFVSLLRYSLNRPRAILVILSILKENFIEDGRHEDEKFTEDDLTSPKFTRKFSDYFLGEIKDHLSFYYPASDYEYFVKFFQYLDGKSRFTYDEYQEAYKNYYKYFKSNKITPPGYCTSADGFLQFLYDCNVLGYVIDTDDKPYFGWCHRERSPSNISPKVKNHVRYDIHYSIMKALDLGTNFKINS
jgi:hypothetical protein